MNAANPKVFFDLDIAGKPAGRVTFELYKVTNKISKLSSIKLN
jgi:hypothetical protein